MKIYGTYTQINPPLETGGRFPPPLFTATSQWKLQAVKCPYSAGEIYGPPVFHILPSPAVLPLGRHGKWTPRCLTKMKSHLLLDALERSICTLQPTQVAKVNPLPCCQFSFLWALGKAMCWRRRGAREERLRMAPETCFTPCPWPELKETWDIIILPARHTAKPDLCTDFCLMRGELMFPLLPSRWDSLNPDIGGLFWLAGPDTHHPGPNVMWLHLTERCTWARGLWDPQLQSTLVKLGPLEMHIFTHCCWQSQHDIRPLYSVSEAKADSQHSASMLSSLSTDRASISGSVDRVLFSSTKFLQKLEHENIKIKTWHKKHTIKIQYQIYHLTKTADPAALMLMHCL